MQAFVRDGSSPQRIVLKDVAEPAPEANEAVIEVKATSVNRGELMRLASREDGWRPGSDVAGVVVQAAADGSGPKEGARVVAFAPDKGWAEKVALPTNVMAELPDDVSFETAAALPMAGLTALRVSRLAGTLLAQKVLVTAAGGGVGHYLVQLLALAGASVTAVGTPPEGSAALPTVTYIPSIDDAPADFQVVFESAGGDTLAKALQKTARGAKVIIFGNSSKEPTPFSFFDLARGHEDLQILTYFTNTYPGPAANGLAYLLSLTERGALATHIAATYKWDQAAEALSDLEGRKVAGKIVLSR